MNKFYVHDLKKHNEENVSLLEFSEWSAKIMNMLYVHDIIQTE